MLETPLDTGIDSSESGFGSADIYEQYCMVTAALPLALAMFCLHMPANKSQFGSYTINNM